MFPLVKLIGERITQILDNPASNQEKLSAEKIKQQITVNEILNFIMIILIKYISYVLKKEICSNVLIEKASQQQNNEFDNLTSEFGAYFGQLIHSQLMKLRNQKISITHAQMSAAAANTKTLITPQFINSNSIID